MLACYVQLEVEPAAATCVSPTQAFAPQQRCGCCKRVNAAALPSSTRFMPCTCSVIEQARRLNTRKHLQVSGGAALADAAMQLRFYVYDTIGRLYAGSMFEIMRDFPDTEAAVLDCAACMKRTSLHQHVVDSLTAAVRSRLLHPGARRLCYKLCVPEVYEPAPARSRFARHGGALAAAAPGCASLARVAAFKGTVAASRCIQVRHVTAARRVCTSRRMARALCPCARVCSVQACCHEFGIGFACAKHTRTKQRRRIADSSNGNAGPECAPERCFTVQAWRQRIFSTATSTRSACCRRLTAMAS